MDTLEDRPHPQVRGTSPRINDTKDRLEDSPTPLISLLERMNGSSSLSLASLLRGVVSFKCGVGGLLMCREL